jgi:ABC-type sulfate transport system permease subunit
MFYETVPIVDSTEGVVSSLMFCAAGPFSAVLRASGLVLMFCAPELVFGGTEGVVSRFHVLRSRTHFRR